jgi:hypothetical protein
MMVFPFIMGLPYWLYVVLFLAFLVAALWFKRYLRYSLRHGPRWGKSPGRRVKITPRSSVPYSPRPRPAPPLRPVTVTAPPVPRYDYCRRYPDLLALCGGDVTRADRLVDIESKSSATAAPDAWVNLAISRFTMD